MSAYLISEPHARTTWRMRVSDPVNANLISQILFLLRIVLFLHVQRFLGLSQYTSASATAAPPPCLVSYSAPLIVNQLTLALSI